MTIPPTTDKVEGNIVSLIDITEGNNVIEEWARVNVWITTEGKHVTLFFGSTSRYGRNGHKLRPKGML
jgi:hypothetical protein